MAINDGGSPAFPYAVTTISVTNGVIISSGGPVPYLDAEINDLQFSQSADVLYITHPNHKPATLSRYSEHSWRYEVPEFENGPYVDQAIGDQDISLTLSGMTDRVTLTSTATDFSGTVAGDFIEYSHRGQKVLGLVKAKLSSYVVEVEPLEDRSLVLSKEVYSPGLYTGWDGTNSVPTYNSTITGTGVSVAFSATGVVTREHIGNYLRFSGRTGVYYWMLVTGAEDILRQGAYGIVATGDILTITVPTGIVTRGKRQINARLTASTSAFFTLATDATDRPFRLVLGDTVVHARGRPEFTISGIVNIGDDFVALANIDGLLPGDFITGTGIPANTQLVSVIYDIVQSYATLSNLVTDNHTGNFTINSSTTQYLSVSLDRPVPRSVEGLSVVQKGTTNDWNRGAWYTGNYPSTVSFHEGRLGFGGTYLQPQTVWLSKTDDLYNMAATDEKLRVLDDSAITFTIASDTVSLIQWMSSRQVLLIGTVGGEWKVSSTTEGAPLSPKTVSVHAQSTYGCAYTRPLQIGKSILYLQRAGRKLREMSYDYQTDSQVSLDLTIFADHIFKNYGGAEQLCYQALPESVVYVRLGNGQIAALSYEPDQKVYAWSRFVLGGPDATVESIAAVPEGDQYRLYMVVTRMINAVLVRTIEVLEPEFRPSSSTDYTDMVFMDNYQTGSPATGNPAVTGLNDFRACTVNAIIDNTVYHDLVVSASGTLTLPATPATRFFVGFGFTSTLKTFPIEVPLPNGTGQGKLKRIDHLSFRVLDTVGFTFGTSLARLFESVIGGSTPPMTNTDVRVVYASGHEIRGSFYVVQSKSYPLTILSIMPEYTQHQ